MALRPEKSPERGCKRPRSWGAVLSPVLHILRSGMSLVSGVLCQSWSDLIGWIGRISRDGQPMRVDGLRFSLIVTVLLEALFCIQLGIKGSVSPAKASVPSPIPKYEELTLAFPYLTLDYI